MRKQITLSILFLCTIGAFAQQSGTVQYQETRKLDIHFDGDMPPPPGLPTEHTNKTLLFLMMWLRYIKTILQIPIT